MSVEKNVLDLFKVMVVSENMLTGTNPFPLYGFVTDFTPTNTQFNFLKDVFKPLDVTTLFTRQDRCRCDVIELISKQILHYIEVYGLNTPGLFDLEVTTGSIVTMTFVKGVTKYELGNMVRELIYSNAPIKDTTALLEIIRFYDIEYSINLVKNNEIRVMLFDPAVDTYSSGDDFVRWVCYKATGKALLIKNKVTIDEVEKTLLDEELIKRHITALAPVFLRHKPLILALKNKQTANVINKIARLAKAGFHRPLPAAVNKVWVAERLAGRVTAAELSQCTVRDKFKFLNALAEKKVELTKSVYIIRNGKMWVKDNTKRSDYTTVVDAEHEVIRSLASDLSHLKGKVVRVPRNIAYGLPTSRKQTLGHLPFGTIIFSNTSEISSGVYWKNDGGASDLDLSTVDLTGTRTGWGGGRGYAANDIIFSGDITSAPNGAMEFMTSSEPSYGLFVNVFNGTTPCEMQLVVGDRDPSKKNWIDNCYVREKHKLESKGNLLGFVKGSKFVVYAGRMSNSQISRPADAALVEKAKVAYWTVNELLSLLGISTISDQETVEVDYDLSYNSFTFDKLEELFKLT